MNVERSGIDLEATIGELYRVLRAGNTELTARHVELLQSVKFHDGILSFNNVTVPIPALGQSTEQLYLTDRHWFSLKDGKIILTPPITIPPPRVSLRDILYEMKPVEGRELDDRVMGLMPVEVRGGFVIDIEGSSMPHLVIPVFSRMRNLGSFGGPRLSSIRVGVLGEGGYYYGLDRYVNQPRR